MQDVFICAAVRTPVGKYGGALSSVRADDLAAIPLKTLVDANRGVDWPSLDDVILGCANQAGEDNRNVARMALLLAGLPETVSGLTVNRLCGSGMDAVGTAARFIRAGEADLIVAGGVESMSRAPFVMGKAAEAFSRKIELYDTTIGWRFVNQSFEKRFGTESMIETAENIATEYGISREDQDRFAFWSQEKAQIAQNDGSLSREIIPVYIPQRKGDPIIIDRDEHPRKVSLGKLGELKPITRPQGTITAGNSSGINDGAAALLVASGSALKKYHLTPLAKILGMSTAGVPPRIMGMGPVPATKKLLDRLKLTLNDMDILEINEAFAAQALGCIRELGLADNDARINPLGGAIALGHPLGMSGARILVSASLQLQKSNLKRALCTMCVGVGQGIAMVIERV
ncbi:MAG: 3-oxoadipyl-CoA thiolase [Candidatus Edwardsbacteria bacterium]|nr:3-oxoadipyl-CoA thiolase [Candidatus Edwardsbacteria bacterium]MBU1576149.1 3-oxoadipyl-CoA thiolase [Candidatus Edwardsbacteria bacterium]MBU2462460.1 3-oxoadipyl-CoA thiolase [Candidatus Edwardsbacteria bacterium]MBU2593189.1 3-oxoadipyl-CoA thiolase [Candidatus Edwardsbacteria bacterium]